MMRLEGAALFVYFLSVNAILSVLHGGHFEFSNFLFLGRFNSFHSLLLFYVIL